MQRSLTSMTRQWQELLKQRDEEILTMTTQSESTSQTVTALKVELESMKTKFGGFVRRSSEKISKLQALLRDANDAMAEDGDAIKAEGEELFEEFESSVSFAAEQVATTTTTTTTTTAAQASRQSQAQSSRKSRSKKKVKDSGIGMDEDESLLPA